MALYKLKDSPYWWVTLVNPRTRQRIRCSTKTTSKAQAKLFERKLAKSLLVEEAPNSLEAKKHKPTWAEASERWLRETQHKKDHINDKTKAAWLLPRLGKYHLSDITASLIQNIAELKAQQTSPANANRTLALIRSILIRAYKQWDWIEKVPYIKLYKEPRKRIRYLTKDEARALVKQLPSHLADMALFSLHTGLRASNVTGLTWNQVSLASRHVFVHPDQAKSGRALSVPLNKEAAAIIERQIGKHSVYVFTFNGKPVLQPNTAAWRKALIRAGIKDFRWHDLRHTWASWHIQAGTPLPILQELGGWQSFTMVQRYAHLSSEHLAEFTKNTELLEVGVENAIS